VRERFVKSCVLFLAVVVVFGYAAGSALAGERMKEVPPLRVGITPDFPPLIFKQGDQIVGAEADLARMLGEELGRPVKFFEVKWDAQISALLEGKTDIIMSSMTITRERQVRIAFSEPFMKSGLVAAVRADDLYKFPNLRSILDVGDIVGIIPNTTSDTFVKKNMPLAQQHYLSRTREAVSALQQRSISMFVADAPTVIWLVSENESSIAGIWQPLNEEYLAWGVRKDDRDLLARVNIALAKFRNDGRLDMVLQRWLPKQYLDKMK
jgi:ABC-type amino acid transport substrate-binding protein